MNITAIRIKCAELAGWKIEKNPNGKGVAWRNGAIGVHGGGLHGWGYNEKADDAHLPNYPESAAAALELVEWMAKSENGGFGFSANRFQKDGRWEVFFEHASLDAHCAEADTFQLAVCLAFLKANGIDPDTL